MNYFITGGCGLIGSSIIKKINLKKNNIYVADRKKLNLNKRIKNFFKIDITSDHKKLHIILKKNKIDCIIHLAAFLGVRKTEQNPLKVLKVNYLGTKNLLTACKNTNVKTFIFSSSSEIYGEQKKKITEITNPNPRSLYGFSKLQAENLIKEFCIEKKINFKIIRLFNIYGPTQNNSFVIPRFMDSALKNKDITLYGNGLQIRSFCFVEDAVKGILKIIRSKKKNLIYNIGNDLEPIKILNLAKKL